MITPMLVTSRRYIGYKTAVEGKKNHRLLNLLNVFTKPAKIRTPKLDKVLKVYYDFSKTLCTAIYKHTTDL